MTASYTAVVQQRGDWWIGWVEEIPGVNSQGRTREEMLDNLRDALAEALEMNRAEARAAANWTGHPVEYLWQRLLEIIPSWPTGTLPVPPDWRLEGLGCFPCGYGLWGKKCGHPPPPMPDPAVMLLANNWGGIGSLERHPRGTEDPNSKYWRNLRPLLERSGIRLESCFATNAYPGLTERGISETGPFPGASDVRYLIACRDFMVEQLRVVRPALIVTLGMYVPPFLAPLAPELRHWQNEKMRVTVNDLNGDKALVTRAVFKRATHEATVVALLHPSMRNSNLRHRQYQGLIGDEAERKLLGDAAQAARL